MNLYKRMTIPRGLIAGTLLALAVAWVPLLLFPGSSPVPSVVQSVIYLGLLGLTACSRRLKVRSVSLVQRWTINPLIRMLFAMGLNPLGLTVLETRGRVSGKPRRTPVGDGRMGDCVWIIAEHGERANYVRNIQQDPRVRVRVRQGLRYRWADGIATVLPDDDVLARQRQIIRWHPLRAFNAMNVRVLGADLLTVRVQLDTHQDGAAGPDPRRVSTTGSTVRA